MKFDFYQLTRKTQDSGLMSLLEKVMETKENAILICPNKEEVERLNSLIWAYKEDSFLPHDIKGKDVPLLLSTQISTENAPKIGVFFNLATYPETLDPSIERALVFFNGEDPTILKSTRAFFKKQKEAEQNLVYWQIKNGKWTKIA